MSKRRKTKGRRAYLKKFSSTIVGGTSEIDKHYFRESNERARYRDEWWLSLYGLQPDDLTEQSVKDRRQKLGLSNGIQRTSREEVLEKLEKFLAQMQPKNHICLLPQRLFMWWCGHTFFFVQYDHRIQRCYRSIDYTSRVQAMFAFNTGRICWRV